MQFTTDTALVARAQKLLHKAAQELPCKAACKDLTWSWEALTNLQEFKALSQYLQKEYHCTPASIRFFPPVSGCHPRVSHNEQSSRIQSQVGQEALFLLVYTEVDSEGGTDAEGETESEGETDSEGETKVTYWPWNRADQAANVVAKAGTIALFQGEARYYRHSGQTDHADRVKLFMRIGGHKQPQPPGSKPLNLDPSEQQCHSEEVGKRVLHRIAEGFHDNASLNLELKQSAGHFALSWCNSQRQAGNESFCMASAWEETREAVLQTHSDVTVAEIEQEPIDHAYSGFVPRACSCLLRVLATAWHLGNGLRPNHLAHFKFNPFHLRKWLLNVDVQDVESSSIVHLKPPTIGPEPENRTKEEILVCSGLFCSGLFWSGLSWPESGLVWSVLVCSGPGLVWSESESVLFCPVLFCSVLVCPGLSWSESVLFCPGLSWSVLVLVWSVLV